MSETPEQSQLYDYFRSELDKRPAIRPEAGPTFFCRTWDGSKYHIARANEGTGSFALCGRPVLSIKQKTRARMSEIDRKMSHNLCKTCKAKRLQELQDTRRKQRAFDEAKNRSDGE